MKDATAPFTGISKPARTGDNKQKNVHGWLTHNSGLTHSAANTVRRGSTGQLEGLLKKIP